MSHLEFITTDYTKALQDACEAKRELMQEKVKLAELDAQLSEQIAEAKDDNGKPLYSNADARRAALLNHPERKALVEEVRKLELDSLEAESKVDIAKIRWQTEKLVFAAEKGIVSI